MRTPHRTQRLSRLVLAAMLLALLAAMLSPWLAPPRIALLCSDDGSMKAVVLNGKGEPLDGRHSHSLDCPLCLPLHAPPATPPAQAATPPAATPLRPLVVAALHTARTPLPWHSRAPPACV